MNKQIAFEILELMQKLSDSVVYGPTYLNHDPREAFTESLNELKERVEALPEDSELIKNVILDDKMETIQADIDEAYRVTPNWRFLP